MRNTGRTAERHAERRWYQLHAGTYLLLAIITSALVIWNLLGYDQYDYRSEDRAGEPHITFCHGWPFRYLHRSPVSVVEAPAERWPFGTSVAVSYFSRLRLALNVGVGVLLLAGSAFASEHFFRSRRRLTPGTMTVTAIVVGATVLASYFVVPLFAFFSLTPNGPIRDRMADWEYVAFLPILLGMILTLLVFVRLTASAVNRVGVMPEPCRRFYARLLDFTTTDAGDGERPGFRFTLTMLLLIVAAVGCCLAWYAPRAQEQWKRHASLTRFANLGAHVSHDADGNVVRVSYVGPRRTLTGADLTPLKDLRHLEEVSFASANVSDAALENLEGLPNLRLVGLGRSQITDKGLVHLAAIPRLRTLCLNDTQVTDDGLAQLTTIRQLEQLYLRNTDVTDAGLVHFKALPNLRVLDLSGTKITDRGLPQLAQCKKLIYLYVPMTISDQAFMELQQAMPTTRVQRW